MGAVATLENLGASTDVLQPKVIESFRSRRDKVDVAAIVHQRFGEERFCKMLEPGGSMEIPELRKPKEGHLALVERDYREQGLIEEEDSSRPNSQAEDAPKEEVLPNKSWVDRKDGKSSGPNSRPNSRQS